MVRTMASDVARIDSMGEAIATDAWSATTASVRHLVLLAQKIHGEMHPIQFPTGYRQVTGHFSAAGHDDRIKRFLQLGGTNDCQPIFHGIARYSDVGRGAKFHPLGLHLGHAPVNQAFIQFEIGNAITQQTANPVTLFKNRHAVTGPAQLLGSSQTRRP